MKTRLSNIILFFAAFWFLSCNSTTGQQLSLVENGKTDYVINISDKASAIESKAASELQKYIRQITGVSIPIKVGAYDGKKVLVGASDWLHSNSSIDLDGLGDDGFVLKQTGNNVVIGGGNRKGSLYAVYSFLEKYLDCRMYSPDVIVVPTRPSIVIKGLADKQIPGVKFRELYYWPAYNELYADWHKINHSKSSFDNEWGNWVHSSFDFVSPDIYFKTHPEYFALRNGKRSPTQLCLSNPDVYELVVNGLKEKIKTNPTALYWSISQQDNKDFCQCDACKKIDDGEGSPSGSIVNFANKVAANFPDKIINTLAYSYSVKPPKTMKPAKNVLVAFCTSGNLDRGKPYHTGANGKDEYARNLAKWGEISSKLMVWDYIVDFKYYLMPFPNLAAISPNIKFFVKNNVSALFMQGNYYGGGEFAELKSYLVAKLMWLPDSDADTIINSFLVGYYGKAAKVVRKYIDTLSAAYTNDKKSLGLFDKPEDHLKGYLSNEDLQVYLGLLNEAENLVKDNPTVLSRVTAIKSGVEFAYLNNSLYQFPGKGRKSAYKIVGSNQLLGKQQEDQKMLDDVYQSLKQQQVIRISETQNTPEEYKNKMNNILTSAKDLYVMDNKAYGGKIALTYKPTPGNAVYAGNDALIDGIKGNLTSGLDTWQGFYGGKFEGTIDLGSLNSVESISIDFLKKPLINLDYPDNMTFYYSQDGRAYTFLGNKVTKRKIEVNKEGEVSCYSFNTSQFKARYIKVSASNSKNAPLFMDEIIIK